MKIYTRGGDRGETALFGGGRVGKGHARIEALGGVDELNAMLGWAIAQLPDEGTRLRLEGVQHDLFAIGAAVADPRAGDGGGTRADASHRAAGRIDELEAWIDEIDSELPQLRAFVIPGGSASGAALHLARTLCRRAERAVVRLAESGPVEHTVIAYLNRLSDLLFTLARKENQRAGVGDTEWKKP